MMSIPSLGDAEPTLVEKLRQIADAKLGDPMPQCLIGGFNNWATPLSQLAGEAADALECLQSLYDELLAGHDRLRADTDAAIKARLGEPVARVVSSHGDPEAFGDREIEVLADLSKVPYRTDLYALPAPSSKPARSTP